MIFMTRKHRMAVLGLTAVVIVSLTTLVLVIRHRIGGDTLRVNGRSFSLEVANTSAERELGLGNRASMPLNHGMLFVFSQPQDVCFWMKDMHFPLDMIWLSANKKVVYMQQNVSPNTYPDTFCPEVPALYVIELNAGTAAKVGISDGQVLSF